MNQRKREIEDWSKIAEDFLNEFAEIKEIYFLSEIQNTIQERGYNPGKAISFTRAINKQIFKRKKPGWEKNRKS